MSGRRLHLQAPSGDSHASGVASARRDRLLVRAESGATSEKRASAVNPSRGECDMRRTTVVAMLAVALLSVVALTGCAAEGTTRILSYYGDWAGVRGGGVRSAPHEGVDFA